MEIIVDNTTSLNRRRLAEGKTYLSFDCGQRNFAFVLLEDISTSSDSELKFRIIFWELLNLKCTTLEEMINSLIIALDKRQWMTLVDYICCEGQLGTNIDMKVLSYALLMYFKCRSNPITTFKEGYENLKKNEKARYLNGPSFEFVTPSSKFKFLDSRFSDEVLQKIPTLQTGKIAKKKAVYITEEILQEMYGQNSAEYLYFKSHSKKNDDLADAFLQCIFYMKLVRSKEKEKNKIRDFLSNKTVVSLEEEEDEAIPCNDNWVKRAESETKSNSCFISPLYKSNLDNIAIENEAIRNKIRRVCHLDISPGVMML